MNLLLAVAVATCMYCGSTSDSPDPITGVRNLVLAASHARSVWLPVWPAFSVAVHHQGTPPFMRTVYTVWTVWLRVTHMPCHLSADLYRVCTRRAEVGAAAVVYILYTYERESCHF